MLSIPVKLDLDAGAAEAALKNFEKGAKDALAEIVELNGKKVNIDFKFSTSGEPVVKELDEQQAALKGVTDAYNRLTGGQENSIGRTKKIISQFKKKRDSLAVNSKEFKIASATVRKFEDRLRALQGIQKGSIADLKIKRAKLIELRDAVKLNSPEYKRLTAEIDKFDASLKGNSKEVDKSTKKTLGFVSVFAKIAIVSAGIQSISSALRSVGNAIDVYTRRTKDVEAFNLAIQNVGFSQAETTRIFNQAEITANALGAPLQQVEKSYRRMIPALKAVGTSAEDSDKFIEAISARSQTLGLNTEQSGRLLEAFAQVLSKGKLQAEELNQQISELDGAFRTQLADALGVTTAELTEMISRSEVTADVFVEAVNKMENGAEALLKRVAEGNLTIQQFQNIIKNIDTKNIETIGKAIEPAIKAFLRIRLAVSEFLKEFVETPQFFLLKTTFNGIALGVEAFVKAVLDSVTAINALTAPLVRLVNFVLDLDKGFGGLVGLLTQAAVAYGVLTAAVAAYNKVLAFKIALQAKDAETNLVGAGFKAALSGALKLLPKLALAAAGLKLVSTAMKDGRERGKEFDSNLKDVAEKLRLITGDAPAAANSIDKAFSDLSNAFGWTQSMEVDQLANQLRIVEIQSQKSAKAFKLLGVSVNDVESANNLTKKSFDDLLEVEELRAKGIEDSLENAKARLKLALQDGDANRYVANELIYLIEGLEKEQPLVQEKIKLLKQSVHFKEEDAKATKEQTDALQELQDATDNSISQNSLNALKARTDAIKELGRETELLAAANIGIDQAQSEADVAVYEKQLNKINELGTSMKGLGEEEKKLAAEVTEKIEQERSKQVQLAIDAQNAVIAGFEQGVNRVNEKVSVLGQSASALKGSFDSTTSIFVSGLQAATGLIDQVVSREIEGLEVGSAKRKAIITEQLRAQAQAIETENSLAKLKLSVQSQVAQSEARIQQGQLQVMAAQARMSGNEGLAQTLDSAAAAQNDIIAALQMQERVEKRILDINKQTQQQALIDKGLKEQVGKTAEDVADEIGVQVVNLKEAKQEQQAIDRLIDQYSQKMADAATNAQKLKEETQKTAMQEGQDNADKIADALGEADGAAEGLNTVMDAVNGTFINVAKSADTIKTTLQDAITEANTLIKLTGSNARAMGGPVTGGQQYTVNDGGGREAFLSNTGKFSMLPAARNIQWTAPSSGTIISAQVLKAMQRNQRHNGVISNARVDQGPAPKLMAATAMTSDSGSLAKQITTAMSGSTANRITNNVTIQSQSPVNDASDLMTNVARMRLRNSRRFR